MVFLHVLRLSVALNSWTVAALCAVGAAAFAAFVIYGFNLPNRWRYRGIPGPPPSWLLGTLPTFIKQARPLPLPPRPTVYLLRMPGIPAPEKLPGIPRRTRDWASLFPACHSCGPSMS